MSSPAYGKTENLFKRDEQTNKLVLWDFRLPEFEMVNRWHVTEKIDGTNIRVIYNTLNDRIEIRGRTDNAIVHSHLLKAIEDILSFERVKEHFDAFIGEEGVLAGTTVTIYGEGYGAGIQKGGDYNKNKSFRAFDVLYKRANDRISWCNPSTVEMICRELDIPLVPILRQSASTDTVYDIVRSMKEGTISSNTAIYDSKKMGVMAEGVVARTDPYLFNQHGGRVMYKLKVCDL